MNRPPCPRCNGTTLIFKNGSYKLSDNTVVQRHYCQKCRKSFSPTTVLEIAAAALLASQLIPGTSGNVRFCKKLGRAVILGSPSDVAVNYHKEIPYQHGDFLRLIEYQVRVNSSSVSQNVILQHNRHTY